MGKGFDMFMENPYWRKQYEDAPSENLKEYYHIIFDTSDFVTETDCDYEMSFKRLKELPLSKTDIEYIQMYAGSGMARAYYQRYINMYDNEKKDFSFSAVAFQVESRNPFYQVFPELYKSKSSSLIIYNTLCPAEFEEIKEKILSFTDDPDDYLIIDLTLNQVDALYIQAKRNGDKCHLEVAYDKQLPRQCYPLIVGKDLLFDDAICMYSRFCVYGENITYKELLNNGYHVIRFQSETVTCWEVITNEDGITVYEGFVSNGKPYGAGTAYFPSGVVYQEGVFGVKGLVCGNEYYPNGELRFEGLYCINTNYGPNSPLFGRYYNSNGILEYEGRLKFKRTGIGYPVASDPENY